MSYYPAWFDYAKWILLIAGAYFVVDRASEPAGPKRSSYKLIAGLLIMLGLIFASVSGILFNWRALRLTAEGTIFHVVMTTGKNASTTFRLSVPTGEVDNLSYRAHIGQIREGETARVIYQQSSNGLLSLDILSGPAKGYHLQQDDGTFGSWLLLIAAFAIGLFASISWYTDRSANYPDLPEDNREMPDGDVDSKSMLNLSKD